MEKLFIVNKYIINMMQAWEIAFKLFLELNQLYTQKIM